LKQAPRAWYSRIDGYFLRNGFVKCLNEYVIYVKIKENDDTLIVYLYVVDLIFTGNNPKMFEDFKPAMTKKFKMMDIGLSYYIGINNKQGEYGIFVNQDKFAMEVLKKFEMENCVKVNTLVECGVKMSKNDEGGGINSTTFRSLVRSLRYLTCTVYIFFLE